MYHKINSSRLVQTMVINFFQKMCLWLDWTFVLSCRLVRIPSFTYYSLWQIFFHIVIFDFPLLGKYNIFTSNTLHNKSQNLEAKQKGISMRLLSYQYYSFGRPKLNSVHIIRKINEKRLIQESVNLEEYK